MNFYKTKLGRLPGTSYKEVFKQARSVFDKIKKKTKRKPYVRSAYFNKQKIFFDFFWVHNAQKSPIDRYRRLRFFEAAIEVLRKSRNTPDSVESRHNPSEILHRFGGETVKGDKFYVQVKEYKRTGRKQLMSMFEA